MKRRAVLSLPIALLAPPVPAAPLKHFSKLRTVFQGPLSEGEAVTMLTTFKKNFPEVRRWAKNASFINVMPYGGPRPKG